MPRWPEGVAVPEKQTDTASSDPLKLTKRNPKKPNFAKDAKLARARKDASIQKESAKIAAARRAADAARNPDATSPLIDPPDETNRRPRAQHLPFFSPSPSQRVMVSALAACNIPVDGIASYIRINDDTLRKHFRYELAEGYNRTEASLVGVLVVKALGGNMTALTMLLKCVFGWRENGKATDGQSTLESLTTEQRVGIIEALRASLDAEETGSGARRKKPARVVTLAGTADGDDQEQG
jgi:hypothetical protein